MLLDQHFSIYLIHFLFHLSLDLVTVLDLVLVLLHDQLADIGLRPEQAHILLGELFSRIVACVFLLYHFS